MSRRPSEATRAKISAATKGEKNHNYGKPVPEATRAKISAAMIEYWKTVPKD